MKKILLTLALLGGAALAQTASPTTTPATPAAPTTTSTSPAKLDPQTVIGQVGSENIILAEYERAFRLAVARVLNAQGVPFEEQYLTEFAAARPDYLKQYLRDRAVLQLARARQKADSAAIDQQVTEAREGFETDKEFQEALQATGYQDTDDLRRELERQAVVNAYLASLQDKFNFGDAVVSSFYHLNQARFTREAQACAQHILVKTKEEADQIVKDIQGGAEFAQVANDKSQDPGSAEQGGELGCFAPGEMVKEFDQASFHGKLNELQVVKTQFGYHVLQVTERTQAGLMPLEEAAPLIREQLRRQAAQKYLDSQIAKIPTTSKPELVTVPNTEQK